MPDLAIISSKELAELPLLPEGVGVTFFGEKQVKGLLLVSEAGLEFRADGDVGQSFLLQHPVTCDFEFESFGLQASEDDEVLHFEASADNVAAIREAAFRLRWRSRKGLQLVSCPQCAAYVELAEAPAMCCGECHALFTCGGDCLTELEGGFYNFTRDGLFRFLGTSHHLKMPYPLLIQGEFVGFRSQVGPMIERLLGHVLWSLIWLVVTGVLWLPLSWGWWSVPEGWQSVVVGVKAVALLSTTLCVVSLAFAGYYWSGLMMRSLLSAYLRPSSWEQLAMAVEAGRLEQAERLFEECEGREHPGLIATLAVGYLRSGQRERAADLIEMAVKLCPRHPAIEAIAALC